MKTALDLSLLEVQQLTHFIRPIQADLIARYDEGKYPPEIYTEIKQAFSIDQSEKPNLEVALKWKWGHQGKSNFPSKQKALIQRVESRWKDFSMKRSRLVPKETFDYWRKSLTPASYITAAFLTHLLHFEKVPIIDQHNYRAMNDLVRRVRQGHLTKKRPSNWNDLEMLKSFMTVLAPKCCLENGRFDRFMMMYGK